MRLWNRNGPQQSNVAPNSAPQNNLANKRRLKESNSVETDAKAEIIKSPKPSAKSKKIEADNKKFSQLVQQNESTSNAKKGIKSYYNVSDTNSA